MNPSSHHLPGRSRSSFETISLTGLTVLMNPDDASLDIVFVHGVNGHPERTLTRKRGDAKVPDEGDESERLSR
ncbi:hypothetical protein L207DRAFT_521344 [Hyaloscypha variabilis F]|uniref:DUF676 domain-containing protein n=1 Tax=Hyaloscypha variabilis (strain UAMH 11265 / GT02V1 / F) TaxID=1149755 RepID=A0A2J6QR88_HYAVF|nr:hypothetical protein L207DRAFT_642882 [Hyaloscypha variabilis F]PMD28827.1 hypothetical protein L207DRAFT_521344 [Hyaloscypha variabilis F]